MLIGVLARDPEHVQLFGFTALFPVTFVSNVFVPTETMPDWLQVIVRHNPVSTLSDAARGLLVGGEVFAPALLSLGWAVGLTAIFAPLSVWTLRKRFDS